MQSTVMKQLPLKTPLVMARITQSQVVRKDTQNEVAGWNLTTTKKNPFSTNYTNLQSVQNSKKFLPAIGSQLV